MTYYELIRACLLKDAKEHPYPGKGCGDRLPPPDRNEEQEKQEKKDDP